MNAQDRFMEELRYKRTNLIDDIRFSKQQMMNTLYLTILAVAAIIGLFVKVDDATTLIITLPEVFLILIALAGITLICIQHIQQQGYRIASDVTHNFILDMEGEDYKKLEDQYDGKLIEEKNKYCSLANKIREDLKYRNTLFVVIYIVAITIASVIGLLVL